MHCTHKDCQWVVHQHGSYYTEIHRSNNAIQHAVVCTEPYSRGSLGYQSFQYLHTVMGKWTHLSLAYPSSPPQSLDLYHSSPALRLVHTVLLREQSLTWLQPHFTQPQSLDLHHSSFVRVVHTVLLREHVASLGCNTTLLHSQLPLRCSKSGSASLGLLFY